MRYCDCHDNDNDVRRNGDRRLELPLNKLSSIPVVNPDRHQAAWMPETTVQELQDNQEDEGQHGSEDSGPVE